MKKLFLLMTLFAVSSTFGQHVVKGTVLDEDGYAVPGVRISVENSTYGVPSNAKGAYYLYVAKQDTVILQFRMLGFEELVDTVIFEKGMSTVTNNVLLLTQSTDLETVEIYADKRDIAKEVISNVIDKKKEFRKSYNNFQCETYVKTSLEKEPRRRNALPDSLKADFGSVSLRERMNFIESKSITRFQQSNQFKEVILAHNDYAEKSNSTVAVSGDFSDPNSILPTQVVQHNPYIFFEKTQDGDFDIYENLIELPRVTTKPLVSPLALNAFINYKFTLKSVFNEDNQKIYEIDVAPRFGEAALFEGTLFVIDSVWAIKSMDLKINSSSMPFFQDFRVIQDFKEVDGNWIITRREYTYTIKDGSYLVLGNTNVQHSNYQFNLSKDAEGFGDRAFKNVLLEYDEEAFDRDSAYWEEIRPISLKAEEMEFIRIQDSIEREVTSNEYIDSVNADYNKIRFWDIVLSGVGFRDREKKQEIFINPLINQMQPFGIGGYRHRLGGSYSKEFENVQDIRISGYVDYGFRNKDIRGDLTVAYTYLPRHFGNLEVSVGDNYDFVTFDQSLANFFSRGNYVRKTFFNVSQRYEIVNGLYGKLKFDYSTRRDISNLEQAPWAIQVGEILNWPDIVPYETYTVSIFELQLLYRFKQKYILKGNKKIIVGTAFPELRMHYKKGVPNLLGSDVNFDFLEIGISDEVNLATFGNLKWDVEAGTFFGKTADEVQYIERKFIRGSDLFFFSNPLNTTQLLDSTFNTTQPYLQAYAIHHFNGAIMSKIPLINKLKLELVAGGGALLIQEADYAHIEFYAGVERAFKIKRQLFKIGTYYVLRENNATSVNFNLKFGFDFFNTYTNSWSY
ncbi:MAG: DUF5686 family protein [Crocinitomicaceae bacterium]